MSAGPARQTFIFEEGVGPVTVTVEGRMIRLHLQDPVYESTDEAPSAVATALTLPEDAIIDSWYAGIGLRFCFVRLASPELVDQARLGRAAWEAAIAERWSPHLYVFAGDLRDGAHVYSRFFAPAVGVDEDPATGSAAASLVAGLAQRSPGQHGTYRLQISQGVAMGRPSTLHATAHKENGLLTQIIVGGHAIVVGNGTMNLPAEAAPCAR